MHIFSKLKLMLSPTLALLALVVLNAPAVSATLIGDTVSVEYHFPDPGNIFESQSIVVEGGVADTVSFFNIAHQVDINIEAESVLIHLVIDPVIFQQGNFNGIVITGMDWNIPGGRITGLDITTDAVGWNDSLADFTDNSIALNYASLGSVPQFDMRVDLITSHSVPEPAALMLIGMGLVGIGFMRRKTNKHRHP